ncbi:peroxisome proliferator-activated receptor gamma coactivator 1-beta [Latimeria chalumnae]|uniref:peroxisome proliferator-activated receptor gamma coactivator 1-beta n=1 Tax=Latimeria chalumnae TaxID=7897 RepID=UPI00313F2B37
MADCRTLLEEDFSSFVFNYLSEDSQSQFREVSGEECLYSDFPEIDLSQLDASDFDSVSYLSELQWYDDHSENSVNQYNTDDSGLFEIINGENEALLDALTETFSDVDVSLSDFRTLGESSDMSEPEDFPSLPGSVKSVGSTSADAIPPTPEPDEPSLLQKLLLSPANSSLNYVPLRESSIRCQVTKKSKSQRTVFKNASLQDRKAHIFRPPNRRCTELHKHLTSDMQNLQLEAKPLQNVNGGQSLNSQNHDSGENQDFDEESSSDSDASESSHIPTDIPEKNIQVKNSQFTSENELRSVIELIRYMHTYCLPPQKHPLLGQDKKFLNCNGLRNNGRMHSLVQRDSCSGTSKQTISSASLKTNNSNLQVKNNCSLKCKKGPPECSLLKELLQKEVSYDVSKPYRLEKPVYTSFHVYNSCLNKDALPQEKLKQESRLPCATRGQGSKSDLVQERFIQKELDSNSRKGELNLHNDTLRPEEQFEEIQESNHAVRRSRRLNPLLCKGAFRCSEDSGIAMEVKVKVELVPREPEPVVIQGFDAEEQKVTKMTCTTNPAEFSSQTKDLQNHLRRSNDGENNSQTMDKEESLLQEQKDKSKSLPLPVSNSDHSFENKTVEPTLSVALCGTAGLTPPTTPPYKPTEDDLYKPDTKQELLKTEFIGTSLSTKAWSTPSSKNCFKKDPEQTELYAHLSRVADIPANVEVKKFKRPLPRCFGDHDYCQILRPEFDIQRKVLKSWNPQNSKENEKNTMLSTSHSQGHYNECPQLSKKSSLSDSTKQLKDCEIREKLTRHFGFLEDTTGLREKDSCKSPDYSIVFENGENGNDLLQEEKQQQTAGSPESSLSATSCRTIGQQSRDTERSRVKPRFFHLGRSNTGSSSCRSRSPVNRRTSRYEKSENFQMEDLKQDQANKKRVKAIDDGRVIYIRNLKTNITQTELKLLFEGFGEIEECKILTRNRGDKHGFVTFRCAADATLALENGHMLKKQNEPALHLSYGGLRKFCRNSYTDLDSMDDFAPTPVKSKYDAMDFDSLLKEAQRSLHR